jgi:hypothetical protein
MYFAPSEMISGAGVFGVESLPVLSPLSFPVSGFPPLSSPVTGLAASETVNVCATTEPCESVVVTEKPV